MRKNVWQIIPGASSIQFKASLLRIGIVVGKFTEFEGTVRSGDGFAFPEIDVRIKANSVETHDRRLNESILSDRFLHPKAQPWLLFTSARGCVQTGANIRELNGILTVRDWARPITFVVGLDRLNKTRDRLAADFSLSAVIRLSEFRLTCADEISDEIRLEASIRIERSL